MRRRRPPGAVPNIIHGPGYYLFTDGQHVPCGPGNPDAVICRRVADFPQQHVPTGGSVGACTRCGAAVVFDARGPHGDRPRVCMQCASIEPLPLDPQPGDS